MKKQYKRTMLRGFCMLLALLLVFQTVGLDAFAAGSDDLNLGQMQIVLSSNPETSENGAATDLQKYIEKICGSEVPIVQAGQEIAGKKCIYLGTAFADSVKAGQSRQLTAIWY